MIDLLRKKKDLRIRVIWVTLVISVIQSDLVPPGSSLRVCSVMYSYWYPPKVLERRLCAALQPTQSGPNKDYLESPKSSAETSWLHGRNGREVLRGALAALVLVI